MSTTATPYISVVMPVYNQERYLDRAIQSVQNQSFKNWELILIDDGSTDGSSLIVDKYAQEDNRIIAVHQENQWIYASYNRGVSLASGEYITFASSDDYLELDALEICANYGFAHHVDIIFMNVVSDICDMDQNIITPNIQDSGLPKEFIVLGQDAIRENWIKFVYFGLVRNPVNCYKSGIIKKYKFRNDVYGADYLMNIQLASDITSAACHPKNLYHGLIYQNASAHTNASTNKYYSYEHDMFNEFYSQYLKLFSSWDNLDEEKLSLLTDMRLDQFKVELENLAFSKHLLTTEKQCQRAFDYYDATVFQCACYLQNQAKIEEQIINTCCELLSMRPSWKKHTKSFYIENALQTLLTGTPNSKSLTSWRFMLDHKRNPHHIGLYTYQNWLSTSPANEESLYCSYLLLKEQLKYFMMMEELKPLPDLTEKLISISFEDTEKFVILFDVLSMFNMHEEALHYLEYGLARCPQDQALLKRKTDLKNE